MPRRRAGVPYASSRASTSRVFIDTRGQPNLGVAICSRCQTKRMQAELTEDGNIKGFWVCRPHISAGCWDTYDPFRLPAPPPDNMKLPFVRPDQPLTVSAEDAAQLPLEPPEQDA